MTAVASARLKIGMEVHVELATRTRLFSRIVPTVKDIGLWGPRVRKAYEDMGVMEFATLDAQAMLDNDNRVAEEFDAKRFVARSLANE